MKFSVGIPAFKASFLEECIKSILNQTYQDFELIIVNDNSPEDLDSIVNKFSDKRIKYTKNKRNFGAEHVILNWNKCLSFAEGEYFVLMGDDDKMESNFLEEFALKIKDFPKLNVYHCQSYIINEESQIIDITASLPSFETVYENIWNRVNNNRLQFISDFIYRTSFLNHNNGFYNIPLAWAADDITSFIAAKDFGIAHINIPLLNYRRSSQTISNSGSYILKLRALDQEYLWYKNFFKLESTLVKDNIIKKRIELIIEDKFRIKKSFLLSKSFNSKFWCFSILWITNMKKYSLKPRHIFRAYVFYFKSILR